MQKSIFISVSVFLLFILLLTDCAREYSPVGGPKDTLAPRIVKEIPFNGSTEVVNKRFVVKFDEYFQLDNVSEKLIISPPLKQKPVIKVKRKKLIVDYSNNDLKKNATYTFNFIDIIKDYNEGNKIDEYIYSFSTGEILDSMKVSGSVKMASDNSIPENVFIMLHQNLSDSAPRKVIPDYVTKLNKHGGFTFNNIASGAYRIFALIDQNKNLKFDLPNEYLGFSDSIVVPGISVDQFTDTLKLDSLHVWTDSLGESMVDTVYFDSIVTGFDTTYFPSDIELYLFSEEPSNQYVVRASRLTRERFAYGFNIPLYNDTVHVSTTIGAINENQYYSELFPEKDSLIVWMLDTALGNNDTLQLVLQYFKEDSLGVMAWYADTVKTRYNKKQDPLKGNAICTIESTKIAKEKQAVDEPYTVVVSRPVGHIDEAKVSLSIAHDTSAMKNSLQEFYELDTARNEIVEAVIAPIPKPYSQKEDFENQHILDQRLGKGRFALYFAKPFAIADVKMKLLKYPKVENWYIAEKDISTNSLTVQIINKEITKLINPAIIVAYVDDELPAIDTIQFSDISISKTRRNESIVKPALYISEQQLSKHYINEKIELVCNNFIDSFDKTHFSLIDADDTLSTPLDFSIELADYSKRRLLIGYDWGKNKKYVLKVEKEALTDVYGLVSRENEFMIQTQKIEKVKRYEPFAFSLEKDSLFEREYHIKSEWTPGLNYMVQFERGAFKDIYNAYSDTVKFDFTVEKMDSYGNLEIDLKNLNGLCLVQLMDKDKSKMIAERSIADSGAVYFGNVPAASYAVRIVEDANANGKWDTGNYKNHMQPERVLFYSNLMDVKAKWDNKVIWKIGEIKEPDNENTLKEGSTKK